MQEAAWNELVIRYPEASDLRVGDTQGIKKKLNILDTYKISLINFGELLRKLQIQDQNDIRIKEINKIVEMLLAEIFDHMFAKSKAILYADEYLDITSTIYDKYINGDDDYLTDKEIVYFPLTRDDQIAFVDLQKMTYF